MRSDSQREQRVLVRPRVSSCVLACPCASSRVLPCTGAVHSEEEELWIYFQALMSIDREDNDLLCFPPTAQSLRQVPSSAYPKIDHDHEQDSFLKKIISP